MQIYILELEKLNLISKIQQNWVQIITAIILAAAFSYGYQKGIVKMLIPLASIILSALLTKMFLPAARVLAMKNVTIRAMLQGKLLQILSGSVDEQGNPVASQDIAGTVFNSVIGGQNSTVKTGMDSLSSAAGINPATKMLSQQLTDFIFTIVIFVLVMIVVNIGLGIVFQVLDLVTKLPLVGLAKKLRGGGVGLIEGMFYVWIGVVVLALLPQNIVTRMIIEQFNRTDTWLYYFKEGNIIIRIFEWIL